MKNNELLQSICNALALADSDLDVLLTLCDHNTPSGADATILEDCSNEQLRRILEGLIIQHRPPRSDGKPPLINDSALSNNDVLKKLRIALNLHHEDIQLVFEEGGADLSENELGALFRKPGNKHFRECSDALLLQFLNGLNPSLET